MTYQGFAEVAKLVSSGSSPVNADVENLDEKNNCGSAMAVPQPG